MAKKVTLNQIGVLIEDVRDKVKALGEGQKIIEEKLGHVEERLGGLEGKVDVIEMKVDGLEIRVDGVDKKIDKVHLSLKNEIQATFYALKDEIDEHKKQPAHSMS